MIRSDYSTAGVNHEQLSVRIVLDFIDKIACIPEPMRKPGIAAKGDE